MVNVANGQDLSSGSFIRPFRDPWADPIAGIGAHILSRMARRSSSRWHQTLVTPSLEPAPALEFHACRREHRPFERHRASCSMLLIEHRL
jgi:hypothetical protein